MDYSGFMQFLDIADAKRCQRVGLYFWGRFRGEESVVH
jgi:hypothetical protein